MTGDAQPIPDDLAAHLTGSASSGGQTRRRANDRRPPLHRGTTTTTIIEAITSMAAMTAEPEPDWLLHGYIAPGAVTALTAKPKVGKSTLVFALLRALETGAPFAGRATRRARVLYVSEEGRGTLGAKRTKFGLQHSTHISVISVKQVPGATWEQWCEVAATLASRLDLVVFDTYNALAGFHGDEEKSNGAHLERLVALDVVTGAGVAVLLVCHDRKADGGQVDRLRGGGALAGGVDIIVSLERVSGDTKARTLEGTGRYDSTPDRWHLRLEGNTYISSDSPPPATKARAGDQLSKLPAEEWLTAAHAATFMSVKERAAKRTLDAAVGDSVERRGTGVKGNPTEYRVTPGSSSSPSDQQEVSDDDHVTAPPSSGVENDAEAGT